MTSGPLRRHPLAVGGLLLGTAAGALAWLSVDASIDPVAWHPPAPPERSGPLAENRLLVGSDRVAHVDGPEDVAFDAEGRLYTGAEDGTVYRTVDPVEPDTTDAPVEPFARTDGRVLGLEFDGEDLLAAATDAGLLSIGPDGSVETLADAADGREIAFADDLYVADDGTVYFTDATVHELFQDELFELRDTGRLLAYHPDTGETTVELDGLGFANGVEVGPDGESLLVTETSRYRVTRYWFDGERAGESEPFAENLVGYPDNVDAAGDGTYWVAIPSLRQDALDWLQGHPGLKRLYGLLPDAVRERVSGDPYGLVLRLDGDGDVVESHHDPTGDVHFVTSATPHDGALYLGSLQDDAVRRYTLE
ncbi:MAG TPA: SMP-30/gluconolactonase/LRE family protein [Halobacteriales archaeon]|nr:SMP-30/gluconolactonase/LRE family protein [Halobacteriales archaeon]